MTYKRGTVKFVTFSFEIDARNIVSCAPKIFSCAPKNLHLVAQVLPNWNLNFEPCHTKWVKSNCNSQLWWKKILLHKIIFLNLKNRKSPKITCPVKNNSYYILLESA